MPAAAAADAPMAAANAPRAADNAHRTLLREATGFMGAELTWRVIGAAAHAMELDSKDDEAAARTRGPDNSAA